MEKEEREQLVRKWASVLDDLIERHGSEESRQRESIRLRCGGSIFGFYHFTDDQLDQLVDLAEVEPMAFDVAKREAGRRMLLSRDLPDRLYAFAAGALAGTAERPERKSKADDDYLRALVMCVVREVEVSTGWSRYYSPGTKDRHGNTACEVVGESLRDSKLGSSVNLAAAQINDLFLRGRLKGVEAYNYRDPENSPQRPLEPPA
jgi:hypothetical protein